MGYLAALGMADATDFRRAVGWHLQHNHYPPVPATMVDTCLEAIALAADGEWDEEYILPPGITYKGARVAPVWAIVEQHHLGAFVELAEEASRDDDESEY